jgi:hypothetical protein
LLLSLSARSPATYHKPRKADFFCCLSQFGLELGKGILANDQDGFTFSETIDGVSEAVLPERVNFSFLISLKPSLVQELLA